MKEFYFEAQGMYTAIPCTIYYEYYKKESGSRHNPTTHARVDIKDIRRNKDNKSVMHILPRLYYEPKIIEYLEEKILEDEDGALADRDLFGDYLET